jgi:hypothetical protein
MVLYKTSAKFGEHRGIKSHIGEFQTQQIFPIDPSAHGISGLLIGHALDKLQDGDQS